MMNSKISSKNYNIIDEIEEKTPDRYLATVAILSSRMMMIWAKSYGGIHGGSVRFSSTICYNIFPFPEMNEDQMKELGKFSIRIFREREKYDGSKTLAELYEPDGMPPSLLKIHEENDLLLESYYREKPFEDDEDRINFLTNLYNQKKMEREEKERREGIHEEEFL